MHATGVKRTDMGPRTNERGSSWGQVLNGIAKLGVSDIVHKHQAAGHLITEVPKAGHLTPKQSCGQRRGSPGQLGNRHAQIRPTLESDEGRRDG